MIFRRLCAGMGGLVFLLAAPAFGAMLSHTVPRPVGPDTRYAPADGGHVATSLGGSLVTYREITGIAARLLDAAGQPLGHPFYIGPRPPASWIDWPVGFGKPALAFDGSAYVVAWTQSVEDNPPVVFRRINLDGEATGVEGYVMPGKGTPSVFYLGLSLTPSPTGTLMLTCTREQSGRQAICQTWSIDSAGGVAAGGEVSIPYDTESVRLASLGPSSVAVLESHGTLSLLRLDAAGAFLDPAPLALGTGTSVAVVGVGGGFTAIWADGANVRRAAIDAQGTVSLAADPLLADVTLAAAPKCILTPTGPALLSREHSGQIVLRFFSATWQTIGTPLVLGTGNDASDLDLSLTNDARTLLAVWTDADGALVERALELADPDVTIQPTPLSWGVFDQETPRSLRVGSQLFALWSEAGAIRRAELDLQGEPTALVSLVLPTKPYSHARVLGVTGDSSHGYVFSQDEDGVGLTPVDELAPAGRYGLPVAGPIRAVSHGWDYFVGFVDHSGDDYVVSVRNGAGETVQLASLPRLPAGASAVPFDLVALDGGYRLWWADEQGHVRAKDVRGASISDGPDFFAPTQVPTFLSATATSVLAGNSSGAFLKSNDEPWTPTAGTRFSELVDVNGSRAVVRHVPSDQTEQLGLELAAPNGQFEALDSLAGGQESSLSEAVDDRMLLTLTRTEGGEAAPVSRVYASVVTVTDLVTDLGIGGGNGGDGGAQTGGAAAQAGGAAAAGGAVEGHSAGSGATDDVDDAAGAADDSSGMANGEGGVATGGGHRPRVSVGCGCRAARPSRDTHLAGLLVTLAALGLRRRRGLRRTGAVEP